jgi:futalosine hydrolase
MKLLIVSATKAEIGPFLDHLQGATPAGVEVLVTGVGMPATAYALTKHLQHHQYDLIVQAGVGGCFHKHIPLGTVVFVTSDQYGDLGAEDHDAYLDIFDIGLLGADEHPFQGARLVSPLLPVHENIKLPHVAGLTVNTVSGNERTIIMRADRYDCGVESMEGAAFHYVCLQEGVPFAQVRAISNYVTPRDKSQWQMKDAIINLNNWLIEFIESNG